MKSQNPSRNKEVINFENLINKLLQHDKTEDNISRVHVNYNEYLNDRIDQMPDINLSMSSHAMSSFLHDYDLT
jgi:hypothetical protein